MLQAATRPRALNTPGFSGSGESGDGRCILPLFFLQGRGRGFCLSQAFPLAQPFSRLPPSHAFHSAAVEGKQLSSGVYTACLLWL